VEGALAEFEREVERNVRTPGSAVERLRRVARGHFEIAEREREMVRFLFALVHNPPSAAPPTDFLPFYERLVGLVAGVVEEGVARGELRPGPIEVRMLVFMGALGEAVCGSLVCGRPELTPRLAEALVDTVVGGWRA
jgi:hypothetical protein